MSEREKVIGLLRETAEYFRKCRNNASFASKAENHFWELQNAANEAAELLKEQETTDTGSSRVFHCQKCGYGIEDIFLSNEYDFDIDPHCCPNCGRKVKS